MSDFRESEAEPQFSQPVRQITSMLIVLALVAAGLYVGIDEMRAIFLANPYLNGGILIVFVFGVLSTFGQVYQLMKSVQWIEGFASERIGSDLIKAPGLLSPLATLLRSRGSRKQISSSSSRSILDTVAQRIDEDRELTRYIGNTLIFLGLLGTFYGLATTVPALVETIRSLSAEDGEGGAGVFARLQQGLESQLGGMGTAFSSSLLGLAGSLIVGLLELFAGHGQNRFYRELEEWLSTITRVSFAGADEGGSEATGVMANMIDGLAEQIEQLHTTVAMNESGRANLDESLAQLSLAVERMAQQSEQDLTVPLLKQVADGQERMIEALGDGGGGEGIDAESRMRLRSIDVQLLRVLEEMAAGRQETTTSLRNDLATLTQAINRATGGA